jgi:DnaJ-class molecular chaperone
VRNVSQEVRLRLEEFLRGTSVEVQVNDPGNEDGPESYQMIVPPETAPGARFRLPRTGAATGGFVELRLKALSGFRFKVRRSDLQCDLRISAQRAERGGMEMIERPTGGVLRVTIPPRVKRGEVIRIPDEGMPKPRGGRGDLLVHITDRPDVRGARSR